MSTPSPDPYTELEEVLDRERSCLLGGDYDALDSLNQRKEALLARLDRHPDSPRGAERIQARARDNQRLASAAAAGLGAAIRRIGEVQRLDRGTGLYDDSGARVRTQQAGRTLRRV